MSNTQSIIQQCPSIDGNIQVPQKATEDLHHELHAVLAKAADAKVPSIVVLGMVTKVLFQFYGSMVMLANMIAEEEENLAQAQKRGDVQ